MKKKLFTLCFALLCAANFSAFATIIDGISYFLNSSAKTATVRSPESGVSYINDMVIPESVMYGGVTYRVTSIGDQAFYNCDGLTSITMPNTITSIKREAFGVCSSLTTVTIPVNVSNFGYNVFRRCDNLETIIWNARKCADCDESGNNLPRNVTTIIFGEAVEYIPAYLCESLNISTLTLPNSVKSIGKRAFYGCKKLTAINFSDNLTSIGEKAFMGNTYLTSISLPNSVDSIYNGAFYQCTNLQAIEIGSGIKYLYYPFGECSKILDFAIWSETPPIGSPSIDTAVIITIPCGSENLYKAANVWKNYNFQESIGYTFSAKTADPLMGAVDVTQYPDCSTNGIAKFVATPEDGYHFVSWNDGSTTNPRTVEVTEDLAFVATFAQDVQVTGLSLDKSTLTIQPGESYTLVPTITPADATNQKITWTSSNADIAYVYNGTVTALSNGRAVITAETEDGHFTASCIVTVADPISVTGITLSETSINLQIGDTYQLTATVLPADAANKNYTWRTDDATIATVENGLITAVNYGKTTITATTEDGGKTATCEVEVGVPVAGITLDQTEIIIAPGASKKLTATIEPDNATNKNFTWTSSDENIAAVANGWVIGVAEGTATITATTEDGGFVATCQVTVGIPVTGITLNETSLVMMPGNTKQLLVTIEPANASNQNYTLTSDNEDVALITSAGWLVANNVGTATITATSEDGGYTATCAVTVQTTISTAIEYQDAQDISVHKVFENGTIYIIRNGEKYTIDGRKIM